MPQVVLVLLPLALYGAAVAIAAARGRMPSRQALNVHTSLLLASLHLYFNLERGYSHYRATMGR